MDVKSQRELKEPSGQGSMTTSIVATPQVFAIVAVVVAALIGALFTLGVFGNELLRDLMIRIMAILGIFTAASVVIMVIAKARHRG